MTPHVTLLTSPAELRGLPYHHAFLGGLSAQAAPLTLWPQVAARLYVGAFGMVIPQTQSHRVMAALEDMGLWVHPSVFDWRPQELQPLICCQTPFTKSSGAASALRTGAGLLNVNNGRIATGEVIEQSGQRVKTKCHPGYQRPRRSMFDTDKAKERSGPADKRGRWPASLVLTHLPQCTESQCAAVCPVQALGAQSGHRASGGSIHHDTGKRRMAYRMGAHTFTGYADAGTAARFYFQADWSLNRLETAFWGKYGGPPEEYAPLGLWRYLAALLAPPPRYKPRRLFIPLEANGEAAIGAWLSGEWEQITVIEPEAAARARLRDRLALWEAPTNIIT